MWRPRLAAGAALAAALTIQGCSRDGPGPAQGTPPSGGQAPPVAVPSPLPASSSPRLPASESPTLPASVAVQRPAPMPAASAAPGDGSALLAARRLLIPVEGVRPEALRDTYTQGRGMRTHEAIDIAAPRGTRVFAVDDGVLVKLFYSVPGGLTIYQFDREGALAFYYAHLDGYAEGVKEGMALRRGDLIGYVGSTGNAATDAPHLHFAVFRLGPQRHWWKGDPVNPYPALRNGTTAR